MDETPGLTGRELQQAEGTTDWRVLGTDAVAWFTAPSHAAGAALARRCAELLDDDHPLPDVDIRAGGVRVRLARTGSRFHPRTARLAGQLSAAAHELGLTADPSAVQEIQLTLDAVDAAAVLPFWERALGYERCGEEDLVDPGRRLPPIWFQEQDAPRPLRNRLHLDVAKPQPVAAATVPDLLALGGEVRFSHDYYATLADADGNEVDLLPLQVGADGWGTPQTQDWRLLFSALACYPTGSPGAAVELAEAVAALADEAGLPLGIDLRPGLVTLDSGKDRWEMVEGYAELAAQVQQAARAQGLVAATEQARFVQLGIDAVDIPAVRAFWRAALGYVDDEREGVTDIVDGRRVGMPIFLQDLDPDDTARRAQRNRLHVDLFIADDQAQARVQAAVEAGGRVVRHHPVLGWGLVDPEGNELDIAVAPGREEHLGW